MATTTTFAIFTNPRIEDVLDAEVHRVLSFVTPAVTTSVAEGIEGLVLATVVDTPDVCSALCSIRSAHYVMRLTCILDLPQGDNALAQLVRLLVDAPEQNMPNIKGSASFRVRTTRFGTHTFRSVDVEREVGEAVHEYFDVPGRMKRAATIVRADVIADKVVLGVQIHNEDLSKRLHPEFIRDASIRPNVAYAMLHFAGYKAGDVLLDPFVGSGTIAMEAAVRFPMNRIVGLDKSERVVKGAQANADMLGLTNVELTAANARNLSRTVGRNSIDCIVTNPPWGIRIGKNEEMDDLYRGFLASATEVLKVGGRVATLLIRWESFLHHCRSSGRWVVKMARPIRTGDMLPVLFVIERVDDTIWDGIKRDIFHLVEASRKGDGVVEATPPAPASDPTVAADDADSEPPQAAPPRKRRFSQ